MDFFRDVLVQVLAAVVVASLGALTLLAFWDKVRRRLLVDPNRVPLVELDNEQQVVRNIGEETAVNGRLYHVFVPSIVHRREKGTVRVSFVTSLPNLMSGEEKPVEASMLCGVVNKEVFLLQYQNAAGSVFQAVIEPVSPRGDAEVLHPPRRIRWRERRFMLPSDPDLASDLRLARRIKGDIGVTQMLVDAAGLGASD